MPAGAFALVENSMDAIAAKQPAQPVMDGLPPERRRWAVAAIFTALAMASLDTAIANIALPAIAADLHVSPAEVVWVVNRSEEHTSELQSHLNIVCPLLLEKIKCRQQY